MGTQNAGRFYSLISGKTSLAPMLCIECEAELADNPARLSAEHLGPGIHPSVAPAGLLIP